MKQQCNATCPSETPCAAFSMLALTQVPLTHTFLIAALNNKSATWNATLRSRPLAGCSPSQLQLITVPATASATVSLTASEALWSFFFPVGSVSTARIHSLDYFPRFFFCFFWFVFVCLPALCVFVVFFFSSIEGQRVRTGSRTAGANHQTHSLAS